MSKVQLAPIKKTMRQNDLHKRFFLLFMGQPTKNGNVFTPTFPVGRPIFWRYICSVCVCLNDILQLLELYTYTYIYIFFFDPILLENKYVLEGMWWSGGCFTQVLLSDQETGSWAQPLSSVHSCTEVDFRLQKVHLVCGWHAMFLSRGKLLPDASSIRTTATKRVALCVPTHMGHVFII